jgi:CRP-like cAMP-binding protein
LNLLIRRLEQFATLSDMEKVALRGAVSAPRRHHTSQISITHQAAANGMTVVLEGLACRYKLLGIGRRQIMGYLIAGDICSLPMRSLHASHYCIGTLGPTETAVLSPERIFNNPERYPNLTQALWRACAAEQSTTREWITNVGHRTAYERVAHLFCELFLRLQQVGLAKGDRCNLPLTQRDLGDALALSSVHVNRVLRQMRLDGLVTFRYGQLILQDLAALRGAAGFDATYLYLQPPRQDFAVNPANTWRPSRS